jgi:hypothetical protein
MRHLCIVAFMCVLHQAICKEFMEAERGLPNKVLHALPEFVSGETLAALKRSVINQFVNETGAQRCLPSSCVLPRAKVAADVGEKLRRALAFAEQAADMNIPVAAKGGSHVYLPALRTQLGGQSETDFHDDFDVDDPRKEALWTALLYLEAASGDRFLVRMRDNPEHVESHEIKPGTLILFKSSEVQHTAIGIAHESGRLALGPVALNGASQDSDAEASIDVFRSRILSWGSSSSNSNSYGSSNTNSGSYSTNSNSTDSCNPITTRIAVAVAALTVGNGVV